MVEDYLDFHRRMMELEISLAEHESEIGKGTILQDIERLQTMRTACERAFRQFRGSKKEEEEGEPSTTQSSGKIKKNRKNDKNRKKALSKPIVVERIKIYTILRSMLKSYELILAKNQHLWSFGQTDRELFLSIIKYIELQYRNFHMDMAQQINEKRDRIDFGHFNHIEKLLHQQFCTMAIRNFPVISKSITTFDRNKLTDGDRKVLNAMGGTTFHMMINYLEVKRPYLPKNSTSFLKQHAIIRQQIYQQTVKQIQKPQDDERDTSTGGQQKKKKKKNRKRKNIDGSIQNNLKYSQSQLLKQNEIESIDKCIEQDPQFEELIKAIETLRIVEDQRLPCNVTCQWLQTQQEFTRNMLLFA